jgi:molybdate transport system substrate-binding protein
VTIPRILAALLLTICATLTAAEAAPVRVAAAADLTKAMDDLIALHTKTAAQEVTVTFGSSGLLKKQIAEGAPFDVFFSANVGFIDDLIAKNQAVADSKALYARGRIVLWTKGGAVAPPAGLADLTDGRFRRIAIANPEHAPYGLAAQQALQKLGLWDGVRERLVFGENIAQTMQYVQSGNAEVGIVALSLAIATPGGSWALLDDTLHQPIDQGLAITSRAADPAAARAFVATVTGEAGRTIMRRDGFVLPGEQLDPAILTEAHGRLAR